MDENLPAEAAELLRSKGHDAETVADEGLQGADDITVEREARKEQRVLVSLDLDFADLRSYLAEDSAGIIVIRSRSQDKLTVLDFLRRIIAKVESDSPAGAIWIVEPTRIRVRGT
ncbi:MAG: DUF5615 family PIN-like protein [Acidobacteria bacterium]|nr:DUF5615 family PIN-like protein [Acidobacteriota bacterium]